MTCYDGPIVDAHHHLWAYGMGKHGWLDRQADAGEEGLPMGSLAPLRRDFLVEKYLADAKGFNIVASIHVEAGWSDDTGGEESAWLDTLDRRIVAARHIFHVPFDAPDAAARIEQEARHPRAAGLRDIVAWHPDPARSFASRPHRMADPAWRRGLAALGAAGLPFDLMLYPHQMQEAAQLASDFPDMIFVLNHCGSPADRSETGMQAWRAGLALVANCPNTVIKISNPVAYDHDWTQESLSSVIRYCFETFGAERSMFGSDAPVSGLQARFGRLLDVYRIALGDRPEAAQRAFFHDTAARIYRLKG